MNTETKHTPTPMQAAAQYAQSALNGAGIEHKDNIVQACNAHDDLVAKIRAIELRVDNCKSGGDIQKALVDIKRHCRDAAALAKAGA